MKINRIDISISNLANKHKPYLYNEMFALAKKHQISGMPEDLVKELDKAEIKYRKVKK